MALKIAKLPKTVRMLCLTFVLIVVYLIIALPFKVMSVIPGFTDIRPVMLLEPVFGVFFGVPGCIAFAVGNLIGDIISDSLRWSSIAGFAANFIGPLVFYLYWRQISKAQFSLRTGGNILRQIVVIIISSVLEAAIIAPFVKLTYPEINILLFFVTVLLNGSVFPIFLGIPLMILMQEELGFVPCHHIEEKALRKR